MAIFVVLAAGLPAGFYDEELHGERGSGGSTIPAGAVEITETQHAELISNPGRRKLINGAIQIFDPVVLVASADVNAERVRRILAGKVIDGVHVTGSDEDARNLMSLALGAQMRLAAGDNETLTTFRDGENVDHQLTPAQLLSLWQHSAEYVSALYAASWALKEMKPIPVDYAAQKWWPAD